MRHILFLLFMALTLQAIAQYPATGNKARLGWQTTGDGLVYRGAIGDTATLDPSGINNAWMLLDTANGNLYAYRAKAWRLVSGGGSGGLTMPFNSVTFNVNETDASERELQYSEEKGYLQYGGLDSVQIPLLPGIWYVRNDTSVTIPKGTVVRATGTLGASGRIKVKHMIANGTIDAMYVLGIAMQDIVVGADGYVMTQGKIRQINTQAYSEGAVLYADVDTLGGLTQTEPTGSNLKLPIAFVVHSASNGTLAVRVSPGTYLRDLHDAYITSPDSSASLYYNASESVWRDTTAAALKSDISGTANYLAKFTGSNAVGNSVAFESGRSIFLNNTSSYTGSTLPTIELSGNGSNFTDQPQIASIGNNGSTSTARPYFALVRSAGTTAGSTNLVPYNNYIGSLIWSATDGSTYRSAAEISAITDSITGASDMPTALFFGTTANGAASPTERMRITSAGNVGINTTTPAYRLDVNGTAYINDTLTTRSQSNVAWLRVLRNTGTTIQQRFVNTQNTAYTATTGTTSPIWTNIIDNNNSNFMISTLNDGGTGGFILLDALRTGIGLNNPVNRLDVEGAAAIGATYAGSSTAPTNGLLVEGNVGIGTSSPSRPLHVNANSSMIIPSGATGTRPALGADGDIRFNSTVGIKNLEWYNGAAWREPVNAARSPAAALANRFSKFNADGLLDTSAVLTQANGRIGIWNSSPAASDSVLTVTGGIRATTGVRATRFTINTSSTYTTSLNNYTSNTTTGNVPNLWIGNGGAFNTGLAGTQEGTGNVSVGSNALRENTTGAFNLAFGADALAKNTTGGTNIAIGRGAGSESTQENNSIAIGSYALQKNNDATGENITIGFASMQTSTSCNYNVAIGASTLSVGNNADENVAIGRSTLLRITTGDQNIGIGYAALATITSGSTNIGIGYEAGVYFGNSTTNFNQTSTNSIYIGRDTRSSANGNSNEIVIGDQGRGNGSNTTTIGNSSTTNTVIPAGSLTVDVMRRKAPVTVTGNHTVAASTSWLICDATGTILLTLPTASSWTGREIMVKTIQPQAVNSAANNVVPIDGVAAGAGILPATDGAWCTLVSDGTNWIIMQRGN